VRWTREGHNEGAAVMTENTRRFEGKRGSGDVDRPIPGLGVREGRGGNRKNPLV